MTGPQPKPWISEIAPYIPGLAKSMSGKPAAKLSANENPLGCSPAAAAALAEARTGLSRYPDPQSTALRVAIGETYGLDPEMIVCGTGSDELLHLAAGAYAGVGDEILFGRFGFSVYPIAARRVGAKPVEAPDADYATNVDALIAAIADATRVIYLANPNNPTGTWTDAQDIARLHAAMPEECLLVIDQAYGEYLSDGEDDGGLALAESAPNVLVTRTFSKIYGLAAERIGWAFGPAPVIDALNRIRGPFNVTGAGQAAAIAAIGDQDFVAKSRAHNAQWRQWLADRIAAMGNSGLKIVPSKANFLLVLFEGELSAESAHRGLMEAGYLTRWLPGQGLPHALRITIGTEDEMRGVAKALEELVSAAL